jgi:hypothetical protein
VATPSLGRENHLVTTISVSLVLGMAVALAVYLMWRMNVVPPGLHGLFTAVAFIVCPPFILSLAAGPSPDTGLALSLLVGTIISANAFLYAGVAAGGYFLITTFGGRKRRSP